MPGLDPGIRVFPALKQVRRRWPGRLRQGSAGPTSTLGRRSFSEGGKPGHNASMVANDGAGLEIGGRSPSRVTRKGSFFAMTALTHTVSGEKPKDASASVVAQHAAT